MVNVINKLKSIFTNESVDSSERNRLSPQSDLGRDASNRMGIDTHFIVCTIDAKGNFISANDKFVAISGYERSELIGRPYGFMSSSDYPEASWQGILEALEKDEIWNRSCCNSDKNGKEFWVEATVISSLEKGEEVLEYVSIWTDVTKAKLEHNRLNQLIEESNAIYDMAGVGTWELDVVSKSVNWSAITKRIHEVEEDFVPDLSTAINFYKEGESRERIAKIVKDASVSGGSWEEELQIVTAKGRTLWVKAMGRADVVNGECVRLYGAFEDIDVRKRLIEELAERGKSLTVAKDRLSLAVRAGGIGIWDWDIPSDHLEWDDQMFTLYAVSKDDFKQNSNIWFERLHPEDRERGESEVAAALAGEKELDSSFRFVLPDGSVNHIRAMAIVQRDESGAPLRMIGTNWDVSESVQRNQTLVEYANSAKVASNAKTEFLANMSHEIRTPMNGVIGMTSLLLESEPLTDAQREYAEVAVSCGEFLLDLIDSILDLSKIESGKLELEIAEFDFRNFMENFASVYFLRAKESQSSFSYDIESEVPSILRGDSGRLQQILSNLVGNALKFTREGEVKIVVRVESSDALNIGLRIGVCDTGIGIAPEKHGTLFDKFTQADASTTRKYGGSGLGLAICKQLVELMGGEIGVISEVGKGSEFWFVVEFGLQKGEESAWQLDSSDSVLEDRKGALGKNWQGRFLLAEDNVVNQVVAKAIFKKMGHEIEIASDGLEALVLLEAGSYDLVLMDLQMPRMDGIEATRRIRSEDLSKAYRDIPIIAMTAHARRIDRERCLDAGMDDFISKPVTLDSISKILEKWTPKGEID